MYHDSMSSSQVPTAVWYISKYLAPPRRSGVGTRGFMLLRELASLGHPVIAFASDSNHLVPTPELQSRYLVEHIDGVEFYWIRTMKYRSVRSVKRILSWLHFDLALLALPLRKAPRPSVIVVSSLSLTSILVGILLSRRYHSRLVFEIRDIWPLTLTEEGGFNPNNLLIRLLSAVERWGYRSSDAIVGTMPNLQEHVSEVSSSPKPVFCVPMGYEASQLEPISELPQQYLNAEIPTGRFLVGYAGTVGATNALETLFKCAVQMQNDASIHFVIVGGGDLLESYLNQYATLPNVTFVGKVPREHVHAVLSEFDVLYLSTFPSTVWKYGQSLNKLIDYMLSGKPIVASYSGFPSMINEADCGTFVPAGDSSSLESEFRRLAGLDRADLQKAGDRGRNWILANRSYPVLAKAYEEILFP